MSEHTHHTVLPAENKIKFGLILTVVILAVEIVGGFVSNSLALLSDAGHVFVDAIALTLSLYGLIQARRPPTESMTFGYHRVGVIVAIVNAISIFAIAVIICYEAYNRFLQPPEVNSPVMILVAMLGLIVNIFVAFWLRSDQKTNLNVRSSFLHALGDALASIAVILGGVIILVTGWFWVDAAVSVIISIIILYSAWHILREGFSVILEAAPPSIDIRKMIDRLKQVPGIKEVHDVHVWSISPEIHALSGHVLIDDLSTSQAADIRSTIEDIVKNQFHIDHTTIQMECQMCTLEGACTLAETDSNTASKARQS